MSIEFYRMSTRDRVLQAIGVYISKHGYGPSLRDLAHMTGLRSVSQVHTHLNRLEAAGKITRDSGVARSIRLKEGA